jgi:Family of unknown function (DUF6328)
MPAMASLESALKTSLGELRMQMLGVQVLFGFQLQGLFQDTFSQQPASVRAAEAAGMSLMIVVMGLILAVPCHHRIVEEGRATVRIFRLALKYGKYALLPLAAAVSCNIYAATRLPFGFHASLLLACVTFLIAIGSWYGLGFAIRASVNLKRGDPPLKSPQTTPHAKIEQLLTEARVILPGVQALLGFQLIVMMITAFGELPAYVQRIHLVALMSSVLATVLLIAPAAMHRIAFGGGDDPRFHSIGSGVVTLALLPLASAIACDIWVALFKLQGVGTVATAGAFISAALLLGFWYVAPLAVRLRIRRSH